MATKKKALGRGLDALVPEEVIAAAEKEIAPTDEQIVGSAIGKVAMILNESIPAIDEHHVERMLRMIISLCQSELRGGYHG